MKEMIEWFKLLRDAGLLTSSFIMGATAVIIAIIGRLGGVLDLTKPRSYLLGTFGSLLILFAAAAYFPRQQPYGEDAQTMESNNYITRAEMDALLGGTNWFCFPDREDGLGVKRIPVGFSVTSPVRLVVTYLGEYGVGQAAPSVGATIELEKPLPRTECPKLQLGALAQWEAEQARDRQPMTQARIDTLVGSGNWRCIDRFPFAVSVTQLPDDLLVAYPITFVTYYDSTGFGVGETVPAGGQATVWLDGSIADADCPPIAPPEHDRPTADCAIVNWEGCWLFDDTARTMTWAGPIDAPFDIGQDGLALAKIRAGYTAVVTIHDDAIIEICVGAINGRPVTGTCPIFEKLEAGSYQISSSDGGFSCAFRKIAQ